MEWAQFGVLSQRRHPGEHTLPRFGDRSSRLRRVHPRQIGRAVGECVGGGPKRCGTLIG